MATCFVISCRVSHKRERTGGSRTISDGRRKGKTIVKAAVKRRSRKAVRTWGGGLGQDERIKDCIQGVAMINISSRKCEISLFTGMVQVCYCFLLFVTLLSYNQSFALDGR